MTNPGTARGDGMTDFAWFRKQLREADATAGAGGAKEIEIIAAAMIAYSSEDPSHPIEHAFTRIRNLLDQCA